MRIKILIKGVYLCCVILSASCTSFQTTTQKPAGKAQPHQTAEPPVTATPQDTSPTVGSSALELLEVARKQGEAGQGEQAAATLERAIKIEPNNPWLWHRLAVLRMQQKKWSQSVELANRSIALSKGNNRLIGGNWLVISLALEGAGNHVAAGKAKRNSNVYLGKE